MNTAKPSLFVLAAITAIAISSCKKRVCYDTPPLPPVHDTVIVTEPIDSTFNPRALTAKMAGVRRFAGTDSTGFFPLTGNPDTSNYTVLAITDSSIIIETDTLHLQSYSFASQALSFKGITAFDSTTAVYYHNADSIEYFLYSRPTLCCYIKKQKHTIH
jgi:hypothetical protein